MSDMNGIKSFRATYQTGFNLVNDKLDDAINAVNMAYNHNVRESFTNSFEGARADHINALQMELNSLQHQIEHTESESDRKEKVDRSKQLQEQITRSNQTMQAHESIEASLSEHKKALDTYKSELSSFREEHKAEYKCAARLEDRINGEEATHKQNIQQIKDIQATFEIGSAKYISYERAIETENKRHEDKMTAFQQDRNYGTYLTVHQMEKNIEDTQKLVTRTEEKRDAQSARYTFETNTDAQNFAKFMEEQGVQTVATPSKIGGQYMVQIDSANRDIASHYESEHNNGVRLNEWEAYHERREPKAEELQHPNENDPNTRTKTGFGRVIAEEGGMGALLKIDNALNCFAFYAIDPTTGQSKSDVQIQKGAQSVRDTIFCRDRARDAGFADISSIVERTANLEREISKAKNVVIDHRESTRDVQHEINKLQSEMDANKASIDKLTKQYNAVSQWQNNTADPWMDENTKEFLNCSKPNSAVASDTKQKVLCDALGVAYGGNAVGAVGARNLADNKGQDVSNVLGDIKSKYDPQGNMTKPLDIKGADIKGDERILNAKAGGASNLRTAEGGVKFADNKMNNLVTNGKDAKGNINPTMNGNMKADGSKIAPNVKADAKFDIKDIQSKYQTKAPMGANENAWMLNENIKDKLGKDIEDLNKKQKGLETQMKGLEKEVGEKMADAKVAEQKLREAQKNLMNDKSALAMHKLATKYNIKLDGKIDYKTMYNLRMNLEMDLMKNGFIVRNRFGNLDKKEINRLFALSDKKLAEMGITRDQLKIYEKMIATDGSHFGKNVATITNFLLNKAGKMEGADMTWLSQIRNGQRFMTYTGKMVKNSFTVVKRGGDTLRAKFGLEKKVRKPGMVDKFKQKRLAKKAQGGSRKALTSEQVRKRALKARKKDTRKKKWNALYDRSIGRVGRVAQRLWSKTPMAKLGKLKQELMKKAMGFAKKWLLPVAGKAFLLLCAMAVIVAVISSIPGLFDDKLEHTIVYKLSSTLRDYENAWIKTYSGQWNWNETDESYRRQYIDDYIFTWHPEYDPSNIRIAHPDWTEQQVQDEYEVGYAMYYDEALEALGDIDINRRNQLYNMYADTSCRHLYSYGKKTAYFGVEIEKPKPFYFGYFTYYEELHNGWVSRGHIAFDNVEKDTDQHFDVYINPFYTGESAYYWKWFIPFDENGGANEYAMMKKVQDWDGGVSFSIAPNMRFPLNSIPDFSDPMYGADEEARSQAKREWFATNGRISADPTNGLTPLAMTYGGHTSNLKDIICMTDVIFDMDMSQDRGMMTNASQANWDAFWQDFADMFGRGWADVTGSLDDWENNNPDNPISYKDLKYYATLLWNASHKMTLDLEVCFLPTRYVYELGRDEDWEMRAEGATGGMATVCPGDLGSSDPKLNPTDGSLPYGCKSYNDFKMYFDNDPIQVASASEAYNDAGTTNQTDSYGNLVNTAYKVLYGVPGFIDSNDNHIRDEHIASELIERWYPVSFWDKAGNSHAHESVSENSQMQTDMGNGSTNIAGVAVYIDPLEACLRAENTAPLFYKRWKACMITHHNHWATDINGSSDNAGNVVTDGRAGGARTPQWVTPEADVTYNMPSTYWNKGGTATGSELFWEGYAMWNEAAGCTTGCWTLHERYPASAPYVHDKGVQKTGNWSCGSEPNDWSDIDAWWSNTWNKFNLGQMDYFCIAVRRDHDYDDMTNPYQEGDLIIEKHTFGATNTVEVESESNHQHGTPGTSGAYTDTRYRHLCKVNVYEYVYTYHHLCEGHTGYYCGGHIRCYASGIVYSFAQDQIDVVTDRTVRNPNAEIVGKIGIVDKSSLQNAAEGYDAMSTTFPKTKLNLNVMNGLSDPLCPYAGYVWCHWGMKYNSFLDSSSELSPIDMMPAWKFIPMESKVTDLFEVDMWFKYNRGLFPCDNWEQYEGWNEDNMTLAVNKYEKDWGDMYDFDVFLNVGETLLPQKDISNLMEALNYQNYSVNRQYAMRLALEAVGNGSYSQRHHNHGYLLIPSHNSTAKRQNYCMSTDCSGFASYILQGGMGKVVDEGAGPRFKMPHELDSEYGSTNLPTHTASMEDGGAEGGTPVAGALAITADNKVFTCYDFITSGATATNEATLWGIAKPGDIIVYHNDETMRNHALVYIGTTTKTVELEHGVRGILDGLKTTDEGDIVDASGNDRKVTIPSGSHLYVDCTVLDASDSTGKVGNIYLRGYSGCPFGNQDFSHGSVYLWSYD